MSIVAVGARRCGCSVDPRPVKLVAVTGGPGAGKTAILEMAQRTFCSHVGVLREAAGVVFGGGFPRLPTATCRRAAQRAIYHVQRELELMAIEEGGVAVVLCDRGTVDGVAYWPDDPDSYWTEVGSSLEQEVAHYAAVVHLHTPPADQGYDHSNALRIESAEESIQIDRRIAAAWKNHAHRIDVPSDDDFVAKAARALSALRDQLPACCRRFRATDSRP